MNTNIALIAGNGLAIDLFRRYSLWNPSDPLSFPCLMLGDLHWRDAFPRINNAFPKSSVKTSFELFSNLGSPKSSELDAELRQFITLAYSNFDASVSEGMLLDWPWRKWIRRHYRNISTVVSYNYETSLERAFEISSGKRLYNACAQNRGPRTGPLLFKPHGSIDLEMAPGCIHIGQKIKYPLKVHCTLNNTPVHQFERERFLDARVEGFVVLPAETTPYIDFQWVSPFYNEWKNHASTITHFVIAGISYWHCDKAEIDFLIDGLPTDTKIIIVNPFPPEQLLAHLTEKGRKFSCWTSGPERIWG